LEALARLRSVREVAALANPADPAASTQRAFDAKRERSAAHATLPAARRIAEQLGLPWREVLAVAHAPEREQNKLLAVKTREPEQDWLTAEHAATVLGLVAARLGKRSLSQREYRVERDRLAADDHARWAHGRALRLPTDAQLIQAVGSWDDALRRAGLQTVAERGPYERPRAPALVDLIEWFYAEHGFQPSARDLKAFARGNNVAYPSERARASLRKARAEWLERRRAANLPEPRLVRKAGGRGNKEPDYSRNAAAPRPPGLVGAARKHSWDEDACVDAVARYLAQLRPGERSTTRGYTDWRATQHGAAPALPTIQANGGWEAIRRAAGERENGHGQHPRERGRLSSRPPGRASA
jgi:hypothetical protein